MSRPAGEVSSHLTQRETPETTRLAGQGTSSSQIPGISDLYGVVLKHFTSGDTVLRWDVMHVYRRARAKTGVHFVHEVERRMGFTIRAIQVDGGSGSEAVFEGECRGGTEAVSPSAALAQAQWVCGAEA